MNLMKAVGILVLLVVLLSASACVADPYAVLPQESRGNLEFAFKSLGKDVWLEVYTDTGTVVVVVSNDNQRIMTIYDRAENEPEYAVVQACLGTSVCSVILHLREDKNPKGTPTPALSTGT